MVLFELLYKVVLPYVLIFESLDKMCGQMKASEHYFPVMLFIRTYKVFLTFESVGEALNL